MKVIDFEFAKFKETGSEEDIRLREGADRNTMEAILVDCGVRDERPPVPEWMKPKNPARRVRIEELGDGAYRIVD